MVDVNRSRFEIMADILQACLVPRRKTRVLCKVKLSFMQVNEYLGQLTSVGLLSKEKGKYETTDKGRQFISAYNCLGEIIGVSGLSIRDMNFSGPLVHVRRQF